MHGHRNVKFADIIFNFTQKKKKTGQFQKFEIGYDGNFHRIRFL